MAENDVSKEASQKSSEAPTTISPIDNTTVNTRPTKNVVPLEDALDLTGFGKYNYLLLTLCFVVMVAMVFEIFGVAFIVSACGCDLNLDTQTKGVIAAVPILAIVLSAYVWGWWADTHGRRMVMIVSMAGSGLFSLIGGLAPTWPVLAICKFISAVFATASICVSYALLGECTPLVHRSRLVLMLSSGPIFGQICLTGAAYAILITSFSFHLPGLGIEYGPWRLFEQVHGIFACLTGFLLHLFVIESPKFYACKGKEEACLKVLRQMFALNTGKRKSEYPVEGVLFEEYVPAERHKGILVSMKDQTIPLFRKPLLLYTLLFLYFMFTVFVGSPSLLLWMPTFASHFTETILAGASDETFCELLNFADLSDSERPTELTTNMTSDELQYPCPYTVEHVKYITLIIANVCLVIVNLVNSLLLRIASKKTLMVFYQFLAGFSGCGLVYIRHSVLGVLVFFLLQINIVCLGLATACIVEIYPTYLRAMAVCFNLMMGRGLSFIVVSYIGVLVKNHCQETFYSLGCIIITGAAVCFFLPLEPKHTTRKEI